MAKLRSGQRLWLKGGEAHNLTSDVALEAITTSRIEASLALGRTSFGVVERSDDLCWSISGIPIASFNAAFGSGLGPGAGHQIDDVLQHFAARAMPFVWWVKGKDEDLEARLRDRGLQYAGEESPGMAMALANAPLERRGTSPAMVQRVTEQHGLRTWFETLLGSVELTPGEDELERATEVFVQLSGDAASGWSFYLARVNGSPVGTAALHLGTAAGLYSVGTLPSARRWGVGTALSVQALEDARSAGHSVATLTASELGARLYQALGFKEYFRYREYVWRPEHQTSSGSGSVLRQELVHDGKDLGLVE